VNLLDSLLDAIVRLDGDALVMHVGEKPYVVTTSEARNQFRGPLAWGQVELSSRVLTSDAVAGMLGQILPPDQRSALDEYGATEYEVIAANHPEEQFTIVAARGGDDIWIEMRRRPMLSADAAAVIANLREEEPPAAEEAAAEAAAIAEAVEEVGAPAAALTEIPEGVPEATPVRLSEPSNEFEEYRGLEHIPAEGAEAEFGAVPDLAPDPLSVELDLSHLVEDEQGSGEPYSLDLDSDRDFAEELTSIDAEFDGGMLGGSHDWHDDVMTEGELGELLRATAAAVIAGEIGPDASPAGFAQTDVATVEDIPGETPAPAAVGLVEPAASGQIVIRAADSGGPSDVAARADHATDPETADGEVVQELPALIVIETVAVLGGESIGPATEPVSSELVEPELSAAPEASGEEEEEERPEAGASVTLDGDDNEEDVTPQRPAAVVLPLTRQPKAEGGGDARVPVATTLQRLLRLAATRGAGTVYVVANSAPLVRVDGEFSTLEGEPALSAAFVERLLSEIAPGARGESPSAEWLIDVPEIGRVRCVAFRDHRGPGVIFRIVPARAISADQLGLSAEVQALCSEADGLILVTGGRASGKSTLLTSFVDLINRTRSDHIITTESQIDFIHEHKRSFISQREVRGEDATVSAVRAACREEPDVLIVEDLHTQELAALALDAAESGRLVFASVPGVSTPSALERLIELFPAERREKIQASLAGTLRGIISQVLLRKLRGGRVAAREVLINTPAVAGLILEGKTFQLPAALENGRPAGMMSFAESLASLVREGTVHPAHAFRKAPNRDQFMTALRRSGIDTAIAERLG
jgi:twitching motility protein PilT